MARKKHFCGLLEDDPLWFREAVIYQVHVKSFFDDNQDGIGDFLGLLRKLDYLQDLGVTALWLMPFYPSPLRDDGYDISDYRGIHPAYGTLRDFRKFLREAHRRGLRVITELVANHTSDQHPWFQRARRARPGSSHRNWYVWSDTPRRYAEARIIFQDFETSNWSWDPVAGAYYWHRFYSHQPDLNFDHPPVRKAVLAVLNFWFEMGVDGMRLDAIPYLFEREGTSCENLPETHRFLKQLRTYVDGRYQNRMLLGEANQWPEDACAYFGDGDECHMLFHFPLMPRLFMALHMEDRFPVTDIIQQTPEIPENCQWAIFLRNHDELTLEMVSDEERDYMYRVYARDPRMRLNLGIRRRLFPLLGNHRRRTELANALLFSLPGTPVIYYGDEIGMGDNVFLGDRAGVRTPMQWSPDRNAGFSRADPQKLYLPVIITPEYHYEVVNVEVQQGNPHSVLWWMKRLINLRKRFRALSRGTTEFLFPANHRILAFVRRYENERILVVANLSRFVQHVELDLSAYRGMIPVELFGRSPFPAVAETPYRLALGPHSFYWFYLSPPQALEEPGSTAAAENALLPVVELKRGPREVFSGNAFCLLEAVLPAFLSRCRWFGGKARPIKHAALRYGVCLAKGFRRWMLTLVEVEYLSGESELYFLPLTVEPVSSAGVEAAVRAEFRLAELRSPRPPQSWILHDALGAEDFGEALLDAIRHTKSFPDTGGRLTIRGIALSRLRTLLPSRGSPPPPRLLDCEQSNTSIQFGERLILKIFRKLTPGINPDFEIGGFLTNRGFRHCAPTLGALELQRNGEPPMTLAVLQGYVAHRQDGWMFTLDHLAGYFERVAQGVDSWGDPSPEGPEMAFEAREYHPSAEARTLLGSYLDAAVLLGRRTAELHRCLASDPSLPEFRPEPFSRLYQRSLYQSLRSLTGRALPLLRAHFNRLPEKHRPQALFVFEQENRILERLRRLLNRDIRAMRIRCHGDYHLGQVLFTGTDFVIIDFEGEPMRPVTERRIKRSALYDVAGMLRSFHYAAHVSLAQRPHLPQTPEQEERLLRGLEFWHHWAGAAFLHGYRQAASDEAFLPATFEDFNGLLEVLLFEKALYELNYELNNRPEWVVIPLRGIAMLLQGGPD